MRETRMRDPRFLIETKVPMHQRDNPEGEGPTDSRPQIRRQMERIAKKLGLTYEDIVEMHFSYNTVTVVMYDRNEAGELYRDEFNRVVTKQQRIAIDTFTFLGDERDI
jgi:aryl-alcohol dehydrogenase-like predicted oxidoreductase